MRRLAGLERVVSAELVRRGYTLALPGSGRRGRGMPGTRARRPVGLVGALERGYRRDEGGERGAAAERGRSRSARGTGAALGRS